MYYQRYNELTQKLLNDNLSLSEQNELTDILFLQEHYDKTKTFDGDGSYFAVEIRHKLSNK